MPLSKVLEVTRGNGRTTGPQICTYSSDTNEIKHTLLRYFTFMDGQWPESSFGCFCCLTSRCEMTTLTLRVPTVSGPWLFTAAPTLNVLLSFEELTVLKVLVRVNEGSCGSFWNFWPKATLYRLPNYSLALLDFRVGKKKQQPAAHLCWEVELPQRTVICQALHWGSPERNLSSTDSELSVLKDLLQVDRRRQLFIARGILGLKQAS